MRMPRQGRGHAPEARVEQRLNLYAIIRDVERLDASADVLRAVDKYSSRMK